MGGGDGRAARLLDRLEHFECEGGPLRNCVEWQELAALIRRLVQVLQAVSPVQPR